MMKLYGFGPTRTLRAMWGLNELGIPFDYIHVDLLGGDPRARHVYALPGAAGDVLATWRAVLGDAAWVVSREQAVEDGWFGPVGPLVADRIGDVVVAARGTAAVIRSQAEPLLSKLPGQHGSLSAEEQLVPLLIARSD